jgi:hypothetical protein
MKTPYLLLASLVLVGCHTHSEVASSATPAATSAIETPSSRLTPEQVIAWADLPTNLARPELLIVGEADGQGVLGDYVTLMNGAEAKDFLLKHGYAKTLRIVEVRRTRSTIQVDLEISGKDGVQGLLMLYADGGKQGEG